MGFYRISDLNIEINTNSATVAEAIKPYEVHYKETPNLTLHLTDDRSRIGIDLNIQIRYSVKTHNQAPVIF